MALTEVQVFNRALARVGHTRQLGNFQEQSAEAGLANLYFAECRDEVLSVTPWPFATRRVRLALAVDAQVPPQPLERTDWACVYRMPTDCLRARYLVQPGVRNPPAEVRPPFQLEADEAGERQLLLTDLEEAELVYTVRHTYVVGWPPLFVSALAWRLAAELALGLRKDARVAAALMAQYERELAEAAAHAANEGQKDADPRPSSIRARD